MWDAFVDAWAIVAGAVPAPPEPSEELQRAASILLGLPETDLMTRLDGAQTTRLRDVGQMEPVDRGADVGQEVDYDGAYLPLGVRIARDLLSHHDRRPDRP